MVEEINEAYLEWLDREENALGLTATVRGATDIEDARDLLRSELGYEPTDKQIGAFMEVGTLKYQALPEIGVVFKREEHAWGKQSVFRDALGRYTSPKYVLQALARLEL